MSTNKLQETTKSHQHLVNYFLADSTTANVHHFPRSGLIPVWSVKGNSSKLSPGIRMILRKMEPEGEGETTDWKSICVHSQPDTFCCQKRWQNNKICQLYELVRSCPQATAFSKVHKNTSPVSTVFRHRKKDSAPFWNEQRV